MVTGSQIRAARALLGISSTELAELSSVSLRTVAKIENSDGIPDTTTKTLQKLIHALEAGGIEFIGAPGDRPGVRIRGG